MATSLLDELDGSELIDFPQIHTSLFSDQALGHDSSELSVPLLAILHQANTHLGQFTPGQGWRGCPNMTEFTADGPQESVIPLEKKTLVVWS
jgi:hypothetical protein